MEKGNFAFYIKENGEYQILKINKEDLKDNERQFLDDLKDFIKQNGYIPTIREMCDYVGFSSTSSVSYYYRILEEKGYIKKINNRMIKILED